MDHGFHLDRSRHLFFALRIRSFYPTTASNCFCLLHQRCGHSLPYRPCAPASLAVVFRRPACHQQYFWFAPGRALLWMAQHPVDNEQSPAIDSFGAVLRQLRLEHGFTQEDLAERAHLSVRGLSDLERGVHQRARPETLTL